MRFFFRSNNYIIDQCHAAFWLVSNFMYYTKTLCESNRTIGYCPFEIRKAFLFPTQRCSSGIIHSDGIPTDNNNKLDETFIEQIVLFPAVFQSKIGSRHEVVFLSWKITWDRRQVYGFV